PASWRLREPSPPPRRSFHFFLPLVAARLPPRRCGQECNATARFAGLPPRDPDNPALPRPIRPAHSARDKKTVASADITSKPRIRKPEFGIFRLSLSEITTTATKSVGPPMACSYSRLSLSEITTTAT